MNLTESKLIEQLTFRILTFQDPVKAAKYIFDCMCDTAYLTPEQVSSTQALFLEVTTYLGTFDKDYSICLLYTSPSPRDVEESRMPSSA